MPLQKKIFHFLSLTIVALYAMLVPIENTLAVSTDNQTLLKYIAGAVVAIAIIKINANRLILRKKVIFPNLAFLGLCLLSIFWSIDKNATLSSLAILVSLIVFTCIIQTESYNEKEILFLKYLIGLTGVFIALSMSFGIFGVVALYGRISLSIWGGRIDVNNLAVSLVIPFLCILSIAKETAKKFYVKLFFIFLILLMFYAVLTTGSRGGLLSLLGSSFVYYMIISEGRGKAKTLVLFAVIAITIVFSVLYLVPKTISSRFIISDIVSSGGTGRVAIWENAIMQFKEFNVFGLLAGAGFGTFPTLYFQNFGVYKAAHNDYIGILLELGVIGIFLYMLVLYRAFKNAIEMKSAFSIAILCAIVIGSFGLDLIIKKMFWNVIFLSTLKSKDI